MLKLLVLDYHSKCDVYWSKQTEYIAFCPVANAFIACSGRRTELAGTVLSMTSSYSFTSKRCIGTIVLPASPSGRWNRFISLLHPAWTCAVFTSRCALQCYPRTARYIERSILGTHESQEAVKIVVQAPVAGLFRSQQCVKLQEFEANAQHYRNGPQKKAKDMRKFVPCPAYFVSSFHSAPPACSS